jgi:hypothetical protein
MSTTNIKSRLERLETVAGIGSDDSEFPVLVFPGQTGEEAVAEWDGRYPGTRDPARPIQFVQVRAVSAS